MTTDTPRQPRPRNLRPLILAIGIPVTLAMTYFSGGMPSKKERIRLKEELKIVRQDLRTTQLSLQAREATLHQLEARRLVDLALQEIGARNYGLARQRVAEATARLETAKKIGAVSTADLSKPAEVLAGMKDLTDADAAALTETARAMDAALAKTMPAPDAVTPVTIAPPTANDVPNLDITRK